MVRVTRLRVLRSHHGPAGREDRRWSRFGRELTEALRPGSPHGASELSGSSFIRPSRLLAEPMTALRPDVQASVSRSMTRSTGLDQSQYPPRHDLTTSRKRIAVKDGHEGCVVLAAARRASPFSAFLATDAVAHATPPVDTSAKVVARRSVDGIDYIVGGTTIAPGRCTGWHTHPGEVYDLVEQGVLVYGRCRQDGRAGAW